LVDAGLIHVTKSHLPIQVKQDLSYIVIKILIRWAVGALTACAVMVEGITG
jgi:hypothetical protein